MSRSLELEVDAKSAGRMEGVLWLWRAHNHVTRRVASEIGRKPNLYPSKDSCPQCKEGNDWDQHRVFEFLRAVYANPVKDRQGNTDRPIIMY